MVNNSTNVNKTNNYQEPRIIEHNIDHGIWNLNSRSWFGTGTHIWWCSGADPGFQVRGGALKKVAPSRGRREHCWGISCEKSRFYAKNHIFSNFRGGGVPVAPLLFSTMVPLVIISIFTHFSFLCI